MSFIKILVCPLFIVLTSSQAFGKENSNQPAKELPVLKAKQSLDNIRFLSRDGKFTYYQRRSGDLQVSTNYSNELVIKGEKLVEYLIVSSPHRKKLLISKDSSFHSQLSHHKTNEIYETDFGGSKPRLVGSGVAPKLHLKDTYFSYFLPKERKLELKALEGDKKPIYIQLANTVNSFYLPQVFMLTPNDIIYSDINSKGHEAFLAYSTLDKKMRTVYKSSYPSAKIEACADDQNLYVGEFSRGSEKGGSKIIKIPLYNNPNYGKLDVLYQSRQGDFGNMACVGEEIYFVKTLSYNKELNLKESEIASLNLRDGKVMILSDLDHATQLVEMDGSVLAPHRGKYYIIKGNADLANDEIEKEKTE